MKSILDIGKSGADQLDDWIEPGSPTQPGVNQELAQISGILKKFPRARLEAEVDDGTKRSVDVRAIAMSDSRVFELVRSYASYEPMVYLGNNRQPAVMGMLSSAHDSHGESRLPMIRFFPLKNAYPLTSKALPDARMATMLTGAVGLERAGVGGHSGNIAKDPEHRLTVIGAVSLGNPLIALRHDNHAVRKTSSVAAGLTEGSLGRIFEGSTDMDPNFQGFAQPLILDPKLAMTTTLYIPDSFLESETAYGGFYTDAVRITTGAGLRAAQLQAGGPSADRDSIMKLSAQMNGQP